MNTPLSRRVTAGITSRSQTARPVSRRRQNEKQAKGSPSGASVWRQKGPFSRQQAGGLRKIPQRLVESPGNGTSGAPAVGEAVSGRASASGRPAESTFRRTTILRQSFRLNLSAARSSGR